MKISKSYFDFDKVLLFGISILTIFFTLPAHAHLKWFVESEQMSQGFTGSVLAYTAGWLLIAFAAILIGKGLHKRYPNISLTWQPKKIEPYATAVIGILIGASLLVSAIQGVLFSMNINDLEAIHLAIMSLQGFIGLSLIIGLAVRQAALLLLGLWLSALFITNAIDILENLWVVGAALYLFLRGRTVLRYTHEDVFSSPGVYLTHSQAMTFLRIFLGVNLILLGFSEKILFPHLGLAFLQEHPWNFMTSIGINWFTDELFVFSAGAVEIILGLFLVAGWVTRLTAVVLACLFLTPPFFMGASEMIGHIPHLTIVAAVLLFGQGASFSRVIYVLHGKWRAQAALSAPASVSGLNSAMRHASPKMSPSFAAVLLQQQLQIFNNISNRQCTRRGSDMQNVKTRSYNNRMSDKPSPDSTQQLSMTSRLSKSRHLVLKELGF